MVFMSNFHPFSASQLHIKHKERSGLLGRMAFLNASRFVAGEVSCHRDVEQLCDLCMFTLVDPLENYFCNRKTEVENSFGKKQATNFHCYVCFPEGTHKIQS